MREGSWERGGGGLGEFGRLELGLDDISRNIGGYLYIVDV